MTTFFPSVRKRKSLSAWPMILAMMGFVVVVFVPLLGSASLLLVPVLAVGALTYFVLQKLYREARTKVRELPDSGELPYGFAGHEIRAFCDGDGQVWLRARDVRHALGLERTDKWMAHAYPDGYRRAHPKAGGWFIHPEVVRRHWGGSMRIEVNRFIHWMERELVPLQQKRAALLREGNAVPNDLAAPTLLQNTPRPIRALAGYLGSHWRGEHHFLHIALSGGMLALLISNVLLAEPEYADLAAHYRRYAMLYLGVLLTGTLMSAWWGVGVWRASRRWLDGERSLLVGLVFAMGGMTMLLFAFDRMAQRDHQMTLLALTAIAFDVGPKPTITVSPDGTRLLLAGDMGFGTTNLVRGLLKQHPKINQIELNSPGGSAAEGFALAELVRDRGYDTYVREDCASACVLVFAGGNERKLAPTARFGLHRSGVEWRRDGDQLSPIDIAMERFFRGRGISEAFITKTLQTPFHDIWLPVPDEVLSSGLATGTWEADEPTAISAITTNRG
jgi:hypothetical protein